MEGDLRDTLALLSSYQSRAYQHTIAQLLRYRDLVQGEIVKGSGDHTVDEIRRAQLQTVDFILTIPIRLADTVETLQEDLQQQGIAQIRPKAPTRDPFADLFDESETDR